MEEESSEEPNEDENEEHFSSISSSDESNSPLKLPISKTKWQELEEELTCFVCGELFLQPKTVPCLHTFCTKCIQTSIGDQNGQTKQFRCFVCKAEFGETKLKGCRINASLKYLVGIVKKRNAFVKATNEEDVNLPIVSCSQCIEGAPATMWCLTCEYPETCEECYKSHCRLKIFQFHKVIMLKDFIESPDPVLNYCPLQEHCDYHRNQPINFYCQNCLKFICQKCQCVSDTGSWHKCESIDKVYEAEKLNLEELRPALQSMLPNFEAALQNNKMADHELDECISKEVAWIHEQFQAIRKVVDDHEEGLLQNLEKIKNTGKELLETQRRDITRMQSQLINCDKFISRVLQPCGSGEMFAYYKLIKELAMEITKPRDLDPAYDVNDLLVTHGTHGFADKLNSLTIHQAFHQPDLPNCTVELTSLCIVPVVVKVVLKDKYKLLVPNQLHLLEIQPKDLNYTDLQKWYFEKKGIYYFSYFPKVKEPHKISVTWKGEPINSQSIEVPGLFDYSTIVSKFNYVGRYNKRNMREPQFLSVTPDGFDTIVSDPADNRLIVLKGPYYCYHYVITNGNCIFRPSGLAVGCHGYLYVADTFLNCIVKFKHLKFLSDRYDNCYFSTFGTKGSENGQFNCPQGLVISKSRFIFICDKDNHRIQVFSITKDGEKEEFSFLIGKYGEEPGCFKYPTDLTLNKIEDKLFVADTDNHRVQVFTSSGQFITTFPHHSQGHFWIYKCNREMAFPIGICSGIDGRILVSCKRNKVFIYEEDGTQITTINLYKSPAGIIMKDTGYIGIALTESGEIAYTAKW